MKKAIITGLIFIFFNSFAYSENKLPNIQGLLGLEFNKVYTTDDDPITFSSITSKKVKNSPNTTMAVLMTYDVFEINQEVSSESLYYVMTTKGNNKIKGIRSESIQRYSTEQCVKKLNEELIEVGLFYNLEKYTESKSSVSDVEWLKTRTLKLNDGFIKFECSGRDKKIRIAITYALNDATELKL
ncbi:MAG: hypothetical protein HRU38_09660 [Saccharospirillaceae bacterium]|nr:hypothetical protein [Pseudomonadales bacterium]NRB78918.1 hypothetical protein [Saccharospirillaceae bacterium]